MKDQWYPLKISALEGQKLDETMAANSGNMYFIRAAPRKRLTLMELFPAMTHDTSIPIIWSPLSPWRINSASFAIRAVLYLKTHDKANKYQDMLN
jgi:hypothetical protein